MTGTIRAAMGEAALRLARTAGYANAGTVEFLLDEDGSFFFLEVNARLQVEHPVTEAVTGLDLVEQQLRVAAGEPLGFSQADVRLDGWAMELRVVAEDAAAGFLPSTGVVTAFDLPGTVRVDTGVGVGSTVSPFYDSLLAKVIAHGTDRSAAIATLVDALDATRIEGVATNVDLLAAVLDEPAFRAGDLHTGFLDEHAGGREARRHPRRGDRRRRRRALAGRADRSAGRHRRRRPVAGPRPVAPGPDRRAAALDRRRARADDPDVRGAGGRLGDGHDRRQRDRGEADGRRRVVGLEHRDRPGHGAGAAGRRRAAGRDGDLVGSPAPPRARTGRVGRAGGARSPTRRTR